MPALGPWLPGRLVQRAESKADCRDRAVVIRAGGLMIETAASLLEMPSCSALAGPLDGAPAGL